MSRPYDRGPDDGDVVWMVRLIVCMTGVAATIALWVRACDVVTS